SSAQSALSQKSTGFQADTRFRAEQESAVLRVRQTDRGSGSSALSETVISRRPLGVARPREAVPLPETGAFAILCPGLPRNGEPQRLAMLKHALVNSPLVLRHIEAS